MNENSKRRLLLLALLVIGGISVYFTLFNRNGLFTRVVSNPPALLRQIQKLSELVTVKYTVQKVVGLTEQKVPLGSESILLIVQAQVLGGVDLSRMNDRDFEPLSARRFMVRLPEPKIMHVFVDEKETKVWDRSKTWWTPWVPYSPDLEQRARAMALDAVRKSAIDMGILKDAEHNAQTTIREFLRAVGVEVVLFDSPHGQS